MSGAVDTKTVEMRFDNQNFESNAKQSISTLEKLKSALKLDGASKGLSDIEKASKKLDFKDLDRSVGGLGKSFSALEAIATGVFFRIGQKAADAGLKIVKSLTIDQLTAGWSKYEEKTTAVQTIMSNLRDTTGRFIDEASKMDYVNQQIEKLNWFSDETSYSLTDMTSNVGKFIANGQGLEESVTAMQGIATWAALSGQNSQVAARAMYNISQAMGTGSMLVKDWMSIENANMATAEFKELAITIAQNKGKIKEGQVTIQNFRESLSGKDTKGWFDKEVMMDVFSTYGEAADKIQAYTIKTGETATDVIRKIQNGNKKLAEEIGITADSIGFRALVAAQEAKTLGEAITATGDAVSTKWMQIFELIFGNYLQQKKLWTDLSTDLWDVFAAPLDNLKSIFEVWNKGFEGISGRDNFIASLKNIFDIVIHDGDDTVSILTSITSAFKEVFGLDKDAETLGKRLWDLTKRFKEFTERLKPSEETLEKIKNSFKGLFTIFKIGGKLVSAIVKPFKDLFGNIFKNSLSSVLDLADGFGSLVQNFDKFLEENKVFDAISNGISWGLQKIGEGLDFVSQMLAGVSFKEFFGNLKTKVRSFFTNLDFSGVGSTFSSIISQIKQVRTEDLPEKLTPLQNFYIGITNIFSGMRKFFGSISPAFKFIGEKINSFFESIGEAFANRKAGRSVSRFAPIWEGIKSIFSGIGDFFEKIGPTLGKVGNWLGEALGKLGEGIAKFTENKSGLEIVESILKGGFILSLTNLVNSIAGLNRGGKGILNSISKDLDAIRGVLKAYQREINVSTLLELAMAIGVLSGSMWILAQIPADKIKTVGHALLQLAVVLAGFSAIKEVIKALTKANAVMEGKDPNSLFGKIKSIFTGVVQTSIFANDASAKFVKVSAGILLAAIAAKKIGEAIGIIGESLIKLGKEQDDAAIKKGGKIVAQIVGVFGAFALLAGFSNKTGSSLAAALAALIVIKAISKLISLMAEIGSDTKKIQNIKNFLGSFSDTFDKLGDFILKFVSIVAIAEILMTIAGASALTPGLANVIKQFGKNFIRIALSLILVAGALYLFSQIQLKPGDIESVMKVFGGFIALVGILQTATVFVSRNNSIIKDSSLPSVLKQFGKNFERIAFSLAIVVGAMYLFSLIKFKNGDLQRIESLFFGFIRTVGILQVVMAFIADSKIGITAGTPLAKVLKTFGNNFLKIAASLLIVALAVRLITRIDLGEDNQKKIKTIFGGFLIIVGAISGLAIGLSAIRSHSQAKIISAIASIAALMIAAAGSLFLVVLAVEKLKNLQLSPGDVNTVAKIFGGFLGIVGLIGVLAGALTLRWSGVAGILAVAASYIAAAYALQLVAEAFSKMSSIDPGMLEACKQIMTYFIGLVGVIAVVAGKFTHGATGVLGILAVAASYIAAAIAIMLVAEALAKLATVDSDKLLIAGIVIGGIIAVLTISLGLLGLEGGRVALAAFGLIEASAAVFLLALSLSMLANVDQGALIGAALTVTLMLAALALIAGIAGAAAGAVALGGAALLIVVADVLLLAGALLVLSVIDLSTVSSGLIDVGIALVPIALGCAAAAVGVTLLGAALAIFAVGAIAGGAGALVLAAGLLAVDVAVALLAASLMLLAAAIALLVGDFEGIKNVAANVKEKFVEVKEAIAEWASELVGKIKDKVSEFIAQGKAIISNIVSGIKDKIDDARAKGAEIIDNVKSGISDMVSTLIDNGTEIIDNVVSGIGSVIDDIKSKGSEIIDKVIEGISDAIDSLIDAGSDIIDKVKEGVDGVIGDAVSWGSDLASNFASGISSGISWVSNAASSVASAVRSFLHFSEPDVGPLSNFHTYAPDMIKLWCSGIYSNLDKVENISDAMADSVYDGFSTALEYVSDLIDNGMSDELAIRPVMDLSGIQNGIHNMGSLISGANGYTISGTARLASTTAYGMSTRMPTAAEQAPAVAGAGVNNYNTFNITNDDPQAVAQKVSRILDQGTKREQAVWAR